MHLRGRGSRSRRPTGRTAAVAALATAAALGAAHGAPPPEPAPPRKGDSCAGVTLPGGGKIDAKPGCIVREARYTTDVAAVVWALPPHEGADEPSEGGLVVVDLASPGSPPVTRAFTDSFVPRILDVTDVTGDGTKDVLFTSLLEDEKAADMLGSYFIYGKRSDGFGDLGTYSIVDPKWGKGEFTGTFSTVSADAASRWKFDGRRFSRSGDGEKKVLPLRAAGKSKGKYEAANAVDGDPKTTWTAPRAGPDAMTLGAITITLPRKITVGRVSFATGYDALSPKWGDLFWANDRIVNAGLEFDGDVLKNMSVTTGARWVDYIPTGEIQTKRIHLTVRATDPGAKWRDVCINEIEVYERAAPPAPGPAPD